jgi:hypothetical protein
MRAQTIPFAFAAAAVIVAGGIVLLARAPSDEPLPAAQRDDRLTIAASDAPVRRAETPAALQATQAAAKIAELEAMSETFRNTSFLIAIRDSGYVCNELLRVYGGVDDSGKWTATCSEMLAYTVGVTGNGALRVEPLMQYFDGLAPATVPNDNIVPAQPPPRVPLRR